MRLIKKAIFSFVFLLGLGALVFALFFWQRKKNQALAPRPAGPPVARVTLIEGWTNRQIAQALAQKRVVSKKKFWQFVQTGWQKDSALKKKFPFLRVIPKGHSLEGFLFPDTYEFYVSSTPAQVTKKFLANFQKKIKIASKGEEWQKVLPQLYQKVILASIVQKEVQTPQDMRIVAGIFQKRLEKGIPLESCATLSYILGKAKKRYSWQDTRVPSPYNTYLHYGLPPGPISNPGLAALIAAFHPQKTAYNYFLTSPQGKTIFARTYQEHQKNIFKYLRNKK